MTATLAPRQAPAGSPFGLDDERTWRDWRARKLERAPASIAELVVEVRDPRALTPAEREAIARRARDANMALYATGSTDDDPSMPRAIAAQLGMTRLDRNWLADDDGLSRIEATGGGARGEYVPYTDRALGWHTDGYYNPPERTIRGMLLHCVSPAAAGGGNALMDPEIAWLRLRDEDPAFVRALARDDAMTIPARNDDEGVARGARSGPVFSVDAATGHLHMRYTARTRSIAWHADADVRAAVAALERLLAPGAPHVLRVRLEAGMGIVCNNVLHDRSAFTDDPARPRLVLRARYHDRVDPPSAPR